VQYNRDIRPILSDKCFACHGPDAKTRKAELRLDEAEGAVAALKSGGHAIVPGNADESALVARIFTEEAGSLMPPPESKKSLTQEQKALLKRWVEEGAEYEPHWAFAPPQPQAPPAATDSAWIKNGIDAFILQKLEEK